MFCHLVNISSFQSLCGIITGSSNPLDNSKDNKSYKSSKTFLSSRFSADSNETGQVWFPHRSLVGLWLYRSTTTVIYLEMRWRGISTTDSSAEGCDINMTWHLLFAGHLLKNFYHAQVSHTDLDIARTKVAALNSALALFPWGAEGLCMFLFL